MQKYFYEPELIEIFIELKSNPFCKDIQFLAFSLLTTIPAQCKLGSKTDIERNIEDQRIISIIMNVLEMNTRGIEHFKQRVDLIKKALSTFISNISNCRLVDTEQDILYTFKILFELLKKNEFFVEISSLFFQLIKNYESRSCSSRMLALYSECLVLQSL